MQCAPTDWYSFTERFRIGDSNSVRTEFRSQFVTFFTMSARAHFVKFLTNSS